MKKILIVVIVLLSVFLIYIKFKDKKIYYFDIGNNINFISSYTYANYIAEKLDKKLEKYVSYIEKDMHTTDLIRDINDNIFIENKHIQNILIKSDLITLTFNDLDKETFEKSLKDYEQLFIILRKFCKEKIIFVGFYDKKDIKFTEYANKKLKILTEKYKIKYVDIQNIISNNYPSKDEYQIIGEKILNIYH